jgi:hypothetical protein
MIPREILKKIRQIELRTNRIVTGLAPGARLCEPQHFRPAQRGDNFERRLSGASAAGRRPALRSAARASARFTARTPAASKTNPALNSIRTLKRRERRAPANRNFKPLEFERFRNQMDVTCPVLIPSNSMGLETEANAAFLN